MRNALLYFVLQMAHWVLVCTVGWTWVLGADVPMWKMLMVGALSAGISTVFVPLFSLMRRSAPEQEAGQ